MSSASTNWVSNPAAYINNTLDFVEPLDVISGLVKAAAFGFIVALMGCFNGFHSRGGAQGVGVATTNAVVSSSILILVFNYIITEIFFSHFGRANGFIQLGEALPQIAGPAIAGALYVSIRLGNIALLDFASYVVSVVLMLIFVRIPNPPRTKDGREAKGSVWKEMRYGWDTISWREKDCCTCGCISSP